MSVEDNRGLNRALLRKVGKAVQKVFRSRPVRAGAR
jgi:hypothetical protein